MQLDQIPLWLFFLAVVGVTMLCIEGGFRLGENRRLKGTTEAQPPLGSIVGSTLGLLAFLLAFTFNIALNRFDDRRTAILNEANAIGTTYLRADFLDEPLKGNVKHLLRQYVAVRVNGLSAVPEAIVKSESLQKQLWSDAARAGREHPDSPVCALFISSLNEVIDMHAKRVTAGLHARVPASVWICLFSVAALSMIGTGYYCGVAGHRGWLEITVLVISFAVVMLLVADLDRPRQGVIQTSQQPLIDLSKQIGPP